MNVANALTWSRLFLSPFIYYAGFFGLHLTFLVLFAIGGLTDAFDGFFARRNHTASKKGSILDGFADIFFYSSALFIFVLIPKTAAYVSYFGIFAFIFLVSVVIAWLRNKLHFPHLISNKVFAIVLYSFVIWSVLFGFSRFMMLTLLVSTFWCVIEYFFMFSFGRPRDGINFGWE